MEERRNEGSKKQKHIIQRMSTEGRNIVEQLRRWLRGEARAADEDRLEESAAGDPFLRDALDGYRAFPEGEHAEVADRLRHRLQKRTQRGGGAFIRWLPRAAAAAVALALIGATLWYLTAPGAGSDAAVTMSEPVPEERAAPTPSESQSGQAEEGPAGKAQPVFPPPQPPAPPPAEAEPEPAPAAELAEAGDPAADEAPETARIAAPPMPSVRGRVTDEQGAPLPGVEVILPGATETKTDSTGAFAIAPPPGQEELLINRPGFQPALVPVDAPDSVLIVLEEEPASQAPALSGYARRSQAKGLSPTAKKAAEQPAQPLGGLPAFQAYLRDEQRYQGPDSSDIVLLQFTVRADSTLHDFEVLHSSDSTLNAEAIRLLREGPKWVPQTQLPVIVKQPVVFEKEE